MPEIAELKIMSDYINYNVNDKIFTKLYHVEKGNKPQDSLLIENFKVQSSSRGKELFLRVFNDEENFTFSVFMGMSGNWKWIDTDIWNETKFTRMRLDSNCGHSLLLYGAYMGPKYRLGGFTGVKRGPDPTTEFDEFKKNVIDNLNKSVFNKPICEVLLDQKYFNGIGNYIRSTILYYANVNPFQSARTVIKENPQILELCKEVPLKAYKLNGGQLQDWQNPMGGDDVEFKKWVFYQKGLSTKDKTGRTLWYHEKWQHYNIYKNEINKQKITV
jgi:endonuclease VIII-like 1